MSASTVALVGALCHSHRELLPLLSAHLADNEGEVLPHLLLADVVRWLVEHRTQSAKCQEIWTWLEDAYVRGDGDEQDLVAASAVEMIPDPGQPGADMRDMLGSVLRTIDPWRA